ncbi:MAG: hypothetical protein EBQ67_03150 [Sphingobacteriia bacterium]|nr:hypothetical protein [Sphingobacteriia bacterium]
MGQRLSASIHHVASWWWSAWIEAGQPAGLRATALDYPEEIPALDTLLRTPLLGQSKQSCED